MKLDIKKSVMYNYLIPDKLLDENVNHNIFFLQHKGHYTSHMY